MIPLLHCDRCKFLVLIYSNKVYIYLYTVNMIAYVKDASVPLPLRMAGANERSLTQ
ncbi:MAG: hypothetical protein V7K89_26865 [Nostoc sp.]|uniref:hypothetical protein n=1 Tax=Nostoc sp. TaxID=1180 RepID=UPI002FF6243E